MAAHAAVAVDNARLFASARAEIQARERAEALYRAAELRVSAVLDNTVTSGSALMSLLKSAAGMTDWLAKPLEPHKLYDALYRATALSPEESDQAAA